MDLYFAGSDTGEEMRNYMVAHGCNLLCSQLNERKNLEWFVNYKREHPEATYKIFIDSGAYTAWTKGKELDMEDYIQLINRVHNEVYLYAAVDVIPGELHREPTGDEIRESAQKSWENFLYMRKRVKEPHKLLYTYHVGEPMEYLKRSLTYEDEFGKLEYIALGGLVGKSSNVCVNFLTECYSCIGEMRPDIKTHAFGFTRSGLVDQFPMTSSDSTTYVLTAGLGRIRVHGTSILVSDQNVMDPSHFNTLSRAIQEEVRNVVENRGYTLDQLVQSRDERVRFNVLDALEQHSKYVCKYHKPVKKELW